MKSYEVFSYSTVYTGDGGAITPTVSVAFYKHRKDAEEKLNQLNNELKNHNDKYFIVDGRFIEGYSISEIEIL